jgi:hypothetical protein
VITTTVVTAERHKWQAIADRIYIEPLGSAVNSSLTVNLNGSECSWHCAFVRHLNQASITLKGAVMTNVAETFACP